MATITTRSGKGSPLTNNQVDENFNNLNTDKAELSGAAFTGAITTNSTIDGRDVATDGTKLDGIESGATADQTAAQIKTAYESNSDTNAFTDADHSKLDGIEASADVTDTTNVTAAGALMDSELTSIASVKALNQGVATTDSPDFAALNVNGTATMDGLTVGDGSGSEQILVDAGAGWADVRLHSDATNGGSIYFNDGADAGQIFYYHPENSMRFHTNATERMRIDSSGRVNIGGYANSQGYELEVVNDTNANTLLLHREEVSVGVVSTLGFQGTQANDQSARFAEISSEFDTSWGGDLVFSTKPANGTPNNTVSERMRIDSSGRVGISTNDPQKTLDVKGTFAISNSTTSYWDFDRDDSDGSLKIADTGTERMRIDTSGNVGIGTSSPSASLELNVPTGDGLLINSADVGTIKMTLANGSQKNWGFATTNLAAGDFGLYQSNSNGGDPITAGTAKLYINSSGNVGIGTSSPAAPLDVVSNSGSTGVNIRGRSSDNIGSVYFTSNASAATEYGFIQGRSTDLRIQGFNNGLILQPSGGNVGIGTSSVSAPLHLKSSTDNAISIQENGSATTGTGQASRFISTTSDVTDVIDSNGYYRLGSSTNPVTGAGFTERFRISADGSLSTPTLGTSNVRFGVNAGNSIASGGNYNVVVGDEAGTAITTGDYNVALGYNAGGSVTTGVNNTLVGGLSGDAITTGQYNTLYGYRSGTAITDAEYNVGLGGDALFTNTTGDNNTAVGQAALYSNTTASNNTAVGRSALYANTTGANNVAVGKDALGANTTGTRSTAVGKDSLYTNTTGARNVCLGFQALYSNTTANDNTAVGHTALYANTTGANNTAMGRGALDANTTGNNNTGLGYGALTSNTTAAQNVAVGYHSLGDNTTGANNSAVGYLALVANTTGGSNTAVGKSALVGNTTGSSNTAIGWSAGSAITTGQANLCLGYTAGNYQASLTTGTGNVLVGPYCDAVSATANDQHCFGYNLDAGSGYTTLGNGSSDIRAAFGNVTWATVSDERYKKDIADSTAGLSFINALQPRTFKYKNLGELPETFSAYEADSTEVFKNSDTNHGFIAQEVKTAIDADSNIKDGFRLWDARDDGSQEVAEAALIPVLTKAIQELSAQVEALTARIETLEG